MLEQAYLAEAMLADEVDGLRDRRERFLANEFSENLATRQPGGSAARGSRIRVSARRTAPRTARRADLAVTVWWFTSRSTPSGRV